MCIGDIVLVPNMPADGLFTLCRVTGDYYFDVSSEFDDFGHVRPVEVLTPLGVANEHKLVNAGLRRSLRYQGRLWRIQAYAECIEKLLAGDYSSSELLKSSSAAGRAESIVSDVVVEPIGIMAKRLSESLPMGLQGSEWEKAILPALEVLFPVTINHTGGVSERGADIEVVIANPFPEGKDWMIPIQVKDHCGEEGSDVILQLEKAFLSRSQETANVIAVILLVTDADASQELQEEMQKLSGKHGVPFMYCGRTDFMRVLAKGYLKRI